MRILVFNWRDRKNPESGGAETNIHELAKRWVREGNEVTLFCQRWKGAGKEEEMDGMRVVRGGGRFTVFPAAFFAYITKLRKDRFDVIIDDVNGIPFFTPLYTRRPVVVLFHHRVGDIFYKELVWPLAVTGKFIESFKFPFFYKHKRVVAVSDSSKDELIEMGFPKKNIIVVHNGVDQKGLGPGKKTKHPTVCYLGRVKRYKRLDLLVEAAAGLKKKVPKLEVVIAGGGDDLQRIRRLVKERGLGKTVKLTGPVDEKKKRALLRSSWVFATPSEKEGWGITVLEANASGTPVVAFDVPGLRDSVSHGRSGLLSKDRKHFEANILTLLKDQGLRERLSRDGLEWARGFDWDGSARKFEKILKKVAGKR